MQISLIDVARAYFNAVIPDDDPPTFVQLPAEDPDHPSMCAQLLRQMYGTRGAADGWQEAYSTILVSLRYTQGDGLPNIFFRAEKRIATSVHGDDFSPRGPKPSLH